MQHTGEVYSTGGGNDHRDCSVRAYAVAACIDYNTAYEIFKRHGRRDGHSTRLETTRAVIENTFPDANLKEHNPRPTLNQFLILNPKGHFMIHVRGHALAVTDGIAHDWEFHPRYIVRLSWRLC